MEQNEKLQQLHALADTLSREVKILENRTVTYRMDLLHGTKESLDSTDSDIEFLSKEFIVAIEAVRTLLHSVNQIHANHEPVEPKET